MKGRNLLILVVVAALLCGLAYLTSRERPRKGDTARLLGQPAVAALQETDTLNSVAEVRLVASASTVTVARVEDAWVSSECFGYPIEFERLRTFLRTLSDLKIGQAVAGGERQAAKLGLLRPGSPDASDPEQTGTLVRLSDAKGNEIASLVLGKERMRKSPTAGGFGPAGMGGGYPDGRYVATGEGVYLVSETFGDLPRERTAWLDRNIVNVSPSDIVSVAISNAAGATVSLALQGDGEALSVDDLSEDEEMDTARVSGVQNALSWLTLTDVADPGKSDEDLGFDETLVCTYKTKQGKIYALRIGGAPEGKPDERYARLSAAFEPPPEQEEEPLDEPREEEVAAEDGQADMTMIPVDGSVEESAAEDEAAKRKDEQARLATEIAELDAKVSKWTYVIRSYKVDKLTASREELIKEKAPIDEEAEGPGGDEALGLPAAPPDDLGMKAPDFAGPEAVVSPAGEAKAPPVAGAVSEQAPGAAPESAAEETEPSGQPAE